MEILSSKLTFLSIVFSLSTFAAAIDIDQAKRIILSETPPIDVRITHPSNDEAFEAEFDIPFTNANFMLIQSQSSTTSETITEENIWQTPVILSGEFDFSIPEVQEALASLGDLTEYEISYTGGPDAVRLMCSLDTVANKGTNNEQMDSIMMDGPNIQYLVPRNLDRMTCQAWLLKGFRPDIDDESE